MKEKSIGRNGAATQQKDNGLLYVRTILTMEMLGVTFHTIMLVRELSVGEKMVLQVFVTVMACNMSLSLSGTRKILF